MCISFGHLFLQDNCLRPTRADFKQQVKQLKKNTLLFYYNGNFQVMSQLFVHRLCTKLMAISEERKGLNDDLKAGLYPRDDILRVPMRKPDALYIRSNDRKTKTMLAGGRLGVFGAGWYIIPPQGDVHYYLNVRYSAVLGFSYIFSVCESPPPQTSYHSLDPMLKEANGLGLIQLAQTDLPSPMCLLPGDLLERLGQNIFRCNGRSVKPSAGGNAPSCGTRQKFSNTTNLKSEKASSASMNIKGSDGVYLCTNQHSSQIFSWRCFAPIFAVANNCMTWIWSSRQRGYRVYWYRFRLANVALEATVLRLQAVWLALCKLQAVSFGGPFLKEWLQPSYVHGLDGVYIQIFRGRNNCDVMSLTGQAVLASPSAKSAVQPDSSPSSSGLTTATLRLVRVYQGLTALNDPGSAPVELRNDLRGPSVLDGLSSTGGLWTFANSAFVFLFGADLLYFFLGSVSVSTALSSTPSHRSPTALRTRAASYFPETHPQAKMARGLPCAQNRRWSPGFGDGGDRRVSSGKISGYPDEDELLLEKWPNDPEAQRMERSRS
ncbi:hypothetical protein C8R45DRAFT_931174 [Mycena sanguinolenta]|nr:hypothetical protein C8R45DRAFT_931174 [Mycena sanguinolenta]